MSGFWIFLIVAAVLVFVLCILRMSFNHDERMKRIKYGYPLDDPEPEKDGYIDYSNRSDKQ